MPRGLPDHHWSVALFRLLFLTFAVLPQAYSLFLLPLLHPILLSSPSPPPPLPHIPLFLEGMPPLEAEAKGFVWIYVFSFRVVPSAHRCGARDLRTGTLSGHSLFVPSATFGKGYAGQGPSNCLVCRTPYPGGGGGGWMGQRTLSVVLERHGPPPPRGERVGFSWVLGLQALELRGIENFDVLFMLSGGRLLHNFRQIWKVVEWLTACS